jgi:uncharacterized protein (TIGR03382 family)
MDFLAICQGLGFAIAAGLIIGVVVPPIMPDWGAIAGAAPLGILACAAALSGEGEPVWPALPVGVIGAGLAATVSREVAAGAVRRERGTLDATAAQAPSGVAAIVVLASVLVAAISLFAPPVSLAALAALAWVWLSRRRRTDEKHEGLRVLR